MRGCWVGEAVGLRSFPKLSWLQQRAGGHAHSPSPLGNSHTAVSAINRSCHELQCIELNVFMSRELRFITRQNCLLDKKTVCSLFYFYLFPFYYCSLSARQHPFSRFGPQNLTFLGHPLPSRVLGQSKYVQAFVSSADPLLTPAPACSLWKADTT